MKESIGGTSLFLIVIVIILLFAGIMAFTINHSNAFAVKDSLVSVIEDTGGVDINSECKDENDDNVICDIVSKLEHYSYRQTGKCPDSDGENYMVTGYSRTGQKTLGNNDSSFCLVKIKGRDFNGVVQKYYYQVIVFYSLDIPVIKSILNFKEIGETKALFK